MLDLNLYSFPVMLRRPPTRFQHDYPVRRGELERRLRSSMAVVSSILFSPTWGRREEFVGTLSDGRLQVRVRHGYSNGFTRIFHGTLASASGGTRIVGEFRTLWWVVAIGATGVRGRPDHREPTRQTDSAGEPLSPTMERAWQRQLEADHIVLIDGAMGTELQRRGVPMDEVAWSGAAVLTHPEVVRETHEDYIRAGAKVVITNTFGSTRQILEPAGYGDQVEAVNRGAVELARQARDNAAEPAVAVAGSISTEPPGFDRSAFFAPEKELEAYREAAGLLSDAGVDLIALEMIVETTHASRAMRAALETGLPVWLGVGCKKREDGKIVSFDHPDLELVTVLDALIPIGTDRGQPHAR